MHNTLLQVAEDTDLHVLKVLRYYSIFDYPLTLEEIHNYCDYPCSCSTISETVGFMLHEGSIATYKNYYSLSHKIIEQVQRREEGNKLAAERIKPAKKAGSLIYQFPFVRFVGISGSLSKGFASPESDFDFFIVTENDRLWVCRTLLHIFKKLTFLFGQQHKFCMNYFIDVSALKLEDQNVFTAIELASMIPVKGDLVYKKLIQGNQWIYNYLPNKVIEYNQGIIHKDPLHKRIAESVINFFAPVRINQMLMHLTNNKWRKKWAKRNYPPEDYALAFKTTLHISKNHPANYQKRVLNLLERMNDLKH